MSYRRFTHWDDGRISPCLTEDSHRDDGRISPCLTADLLTGTMDECHHVLQKAYSLGRWTNITMSYRRLSQGRWTNFISPCLTEGLLTGAMDEYHHVLQKTLTGTMNEFHHVLQKTDLLTGTMDEAHHVLQKTYSLRRWTNVTMSYRRLTHWDDGRMSPCLTEDSHRDDGRSSPCLTEDLLTGTMDECHHVLQKTYSLRR
jgi:DNA-binding IscR family transcriptional regulator